MDKVVCSKCGAETDFVKGWRCRKCGTRNVYVPPEKPKKKVKESRFPYKKKEVLDPVEVKELPTIEEEEYGGE